MANGNETHSTQTRARTAAPILPIELDSLDADRFWALVKPGDGCWEWGGKINKSGLPYGHFTVKRRRTYLAHRVAWTIMRGAIPAGLWVLHRCDNPRCCRPDHLFLGTRSDNMRDMHRKGRGDLAERVAKAHRASVEASARRRAERGRS